MRINIAEPCHENWDGMSPNTNGKHCSKCDKTVYDFSRYSDSEIIDFFKSGPSVCGRFKGTQLGRELNHSNTLPPKWVLAACGLLLLSLGSINAQNHPQINQDSSQEIVSQSSVNLTQVIHATFNEARAHDECISRMKIIMNNFAIIVDIDSSRKASITIPQTISGDRVDVELFNIKGDTFHIDSVVLGTGAIVFEPLANGRWTYLNSLNSIWTIPDPPIFHSMGISMPYIWGPPIMPSVYVSNPVDTSILVTMGDTVLTEENGNSDSFTSPELNRKGIRKKSKTQVGPWLIGITLGLGVLLRLAWRNFKQKMKA